MRRGVADRVSPHGGSTIHRHSNPTGWSPRVVSLEGNAMNASTSASSARRRSTGRRMTPTRCFVLAVDRGPGRLRSSGRPRRAGGVRSGHAPAGRVDRPRHLRRGRPAGGGGRHREAGRLHDRGQRGQRRRGALSLSGGQTARGAACARHPRGRLRARRPACRGGRGGRNHHRRSRPAHDPGSGGAAHERGMAGEHSGHGRAAAPVRVVRPLPHPRSHHAVAVRRGRLAACPRAHGRLRDVGVSRQSAEAPRRPGHPVRRADRAAAGGAAPAGRLPGRHSI